MKPLLSALCVLAWGCGSEEPLGVTSSTDAITQEDRDAKTEQMDQVEPPTRAVHLEVVSTELGLIFRLVQDPVEDRFFRTVPLALPEAPVPAPACPTCR
jgi:hypothetical protein